MALKAKAAKVNADCLAGTYFGVDARGKDCALLIAASQGRFRFVERDKSLSVEADACRGPAYRRRTRSSVSRRRDGPDSACC